MGPVRAPTERVSVLLVEDDEDDALLVREMLTPERFEVSHVQSAAEAKSYLSGGTTGCVLLDLSLPDARQLEGLAQLRTLARDVPIVILSGHGDEQLGVRAVREGAQDYLVKGKADADLLARSISYAIQRKRAESEIASKAVAQRGTVTLLFTDLVGSTELLGQLGEEQAEALRRTHFQLLRDAVAAQGGTEVKTLGDGLMVAFPSAVDAVACAVTMQQTVEQHNRAHAEARLSVRVGLNVGEPIRGEDDYFGTPVVVAKRLCDSASGGQILASELVRKLVGSRGGYCFSELASLELRGLSEPVSTHEVAWEPLAAERLPLPPALITGERTEFVGRRDDLRHLREYWSQTLAGKRQLVFVSGEPGIGKTRLAAELALSAYREGATVLYGHSDEEPLVPYQPFVEAFRHTVLNQPVDLLRAQLKPRPHLKKLLPELAQRVPDLPEPPQAEPEAERYLLFEAVASLLPDISEAAPLVLILEDLHWADKPTLVLLRHIARASRQSRTMILGTYRETEVIRADLLSTTLADLRRDRLFEHLQLEGLDEEEVGALITAWAGDNARPAFVRAVYEETEGNPFFVEEVLRHLAESGAIYQEEGHLTSDLTLDEMGIPEGVKETMGRRLMRLSDPTYRVLSIASVIGRRFQLEVLERVSDLGGDALLETLEEAVVARIIGESPNGAERYYFFHALFREALLDHLTGTRRARLHRSIGEVIEGIHAADLDGHLGELAYHFSEAGQAGDIGKAVSYAKRAADSAMRQLAYEEAAFQLKRALRTIDLHGGGSDEERSELLLALGAAQEKGGETADPLQPSE